MNDAWYDTLTKIKNEAPQNIIITSWWDFGHWFKAIADRPVTFDGGTQVGHGAHWVGKSLLTNDQAVTVGILRMLNCGQNTAFEELNLILNDTLKSITTINTIILQSKEQAAQTLQSHGVTADQRALVLQYTHCAAPPDYFITSEDMVGKSGVWGHFGSWNFEKAVFYQKTKKLSRDEAVQYFTATFNMSREQANKLHAEIQAEENADSWIAPWPGYGSMFRNCDELPENKVRCATSIRSGETLSFIVDTKSYDVHLENGQDIVPNSIVYTTADGVEEKMLSGKNIGLSLVLTSNENRHQFMLADPLHASSTFTKLFFLDGKGMNCFKKFDDVNSAVTGRVITWVLEDYDCPLKR
ncbi:MAG: STT3 domain-containing protein [Nanoarchaeota archaeon]|nr:STT3 domain-containing protein [Nanoarchaeota archaeon]